MEELAKEINLSIKDSEVYKRYLICKSNIENNEEICNLRNRLNELKNINCKSKEESILKEYYDIEGKYNSNILVKEYEQAKSEVYDLLVEVCDILWFK